ncbi:MAG: T9SS type A sorting domain-containing protein [Bacteroidetes bacterium]|nr:T9SS type A sorting domain-containing protein [Bacteroidota bacterium]
MRHTLILSFILLVAAHVAHAQLNTWVTQNPPNLAGVYRAVQMVTPTTMFAVGDVGIIARSLDGGVTLENRSIMRKSFYGVNFADSLTGMVVGEEGNAFKTTDGGNTWLPMNIGGSEQLYGVLMVDHNLALVCGGASSFSSLRITRDGGATWKPYSGELGVGAIKNIRMLRPDFIVFVGANGTYYVSRDSARTFLQYQLPYQNDLNDVCFLDELHVVAVGGPSRYLVGSSDQGAHWRALDTNNFTLGAAQLNGVDSKDPHAVVAVGDFGELLYSSDGGDTWNRSDFGALTSLKGVSMYSATSGLVVGQDGVIMRTTDGGASWEFLPRRPEIRTLRTVRMMPDGSTGFAAGGYGSILFTRDSGHTWNPVESGTIAGLLAAVLNADGRGYIVGEMGTLLRTTDAGATWATVKLSTSRRLTCIAEASRNTLYIGGDSALFLKSIDGGEYWTRYHGPLPDSFGVTSLNFFDSLRGVVGSPDGMWKTDDAGITWKQVISTGLPAAWIAVAIGSSPTNAFALGTSFDGSFYAHTTDGGDTWGIAISGSVVSRAYAIYTADGYHATAVGRYGQITHVSSPDGVWSLQTTLTSNSLFGVGFGSTHAGWSCGIRGTILRIDTDEQADVRNPTHVVLPTVDIERIYPNPASDRIRLLISTPESSSATISIMDIQGKRVLSRDLGILTEGEHSSELDVRALPAGSYVVTLTTESALATAQLVVVR